MATYSYIALDRKKKKKKGFISAPTEKSARKEIKKLNLKPKTIKKSNKDPHSTFDHSYRTLENTLDFARQKKDM